MTTETIAPATLKNAKSAVQTFWQMRSCLPDTSEMQVAIEEIREVAAEAKAEGRRIAPRDWVYLAECVDTACDDDGLPRLFDIAA